MTKQTLVELILQQISAVTGRRVETIPPDMGFAELGIESLQAVSIIAQIEERLKLSLDSTLMFDYSTVEKLAGYLEKTINQKDRATPTKQQKLQASTGPIAIVGMSCRFPQANDLEEFFEVLKSGKDCIRDLNLTRWKSEAAKSIGWLGAIDDIEMFANDVFNISENEARRMDPQQRMLLEQVWLALEDAGESPKQTTGKNTGVFVGLSNVDYVRRLKAQNSSDLFTATGNSHSIAANRISYFFDFQGPSITVDTACSSSLVALDLAVKALQDGTVNAALCAGANLILSPEITTAFLDAKMLSPDGRCFSFSDKANGYVRGEGVGVVYLKRLADAKRDGNQIYAVIRATSTNQDGRSSSLLAPSGLAQEKVIRDSLEKANLSPADIHYHEAHGTGTPLGDPIEALALERVHHQRPSDQPLLLGTVKTNIGHLEAAAGIAGLIKTALSLYHQKFFPTVHFGNLNPKLVGKIPHLQVCTDLKDWPVAEGQHRRASISSFGFGGTNAHCVLEDYKESTSDDITVTIEPTIETLFGFSSNSPDGLRDTAKKWSRLADVNMYDRRNHFIPDAAGSLSARTNLSHQLFFLAKDRHDWRKTLEAFINGTKNENYWTQQQSRRGTLNTAFLFTGQGSQYTGMFKEIYLSEDIFKKQFDLGLVEAQKYFDQNLFEVWTSKDKESLLLETDYGQILLFIGEYSLASLLQKKYHLEPMFVAGHSLGEITAAAFSGILSFEDAIKLVAYRGKLMRQTPSGAMTAIFARKDRITKLLESENLPLDFAAHNGPELQMVSGATTYIEKLGQILDREKIRYKRTKVKQAFHSRLMEVAASNFAKVLPEVQFRRGRIPVISSVNSEMYFETSHDYWVDQILKPTQFELLIQKLTELGTNTFVEIGPSAVLNSMAQRFVDSKNKHFIHLTEEPIDSKNIYIKSLTRLISLGLIEPHTKSKMIYLPATRLHKNYFWYLQQEKGAQMSSETNQQSRINAKASELTRELTELLASLMKIPTNEVSATTNLVDIGADSLVLLNAVQTLKDRYGVEIPMADIFKDLNTLERIAHFVAQSITPTVNTPPSINIPPSTEAAIAVQNMASIPAGARSDILAVIQAQMHLMNQQLAVLQNSAGAPVSIPTMPSSFSTPPIPPPPLASDLPTGQEKRGVLGNFQTKANTTRSGESGEKELYLKDFINRFTSQTSKTKAHVQKYRFSLADNRVSAGFRPNTKEMVYPIHCVKAKGSRFTDLDGKEYIDFTMGFGVNLFGHSPDFIESKVIEQIKLGMCVGPQSFLAGPVAQMVTELTGLERVAFLNSGTEAVMTAIRLARAHTKRTKIVIFDGSYHGHFDGVLARASGNLKSTPVAAGITSGMANDVIILEYGSAKSLEVIKQLGPELAAVLVEPVQSRFPENQPQAFLKQVRELTKNSGTAFIWDEVITGFRINVGGAQKHFGIQADIAVYGKILGGGLPIGAVAGKHEYLDFIDGGYWQFGDDSFPQSEMTFFAGTFCKHPLAMAAAHATLEKLKSDGPKLIDEVNRKTENLKNNLNKFFDSVGVDIQVNNFGSLFRFKAPLNLDLFFAELNLRGFYIWEGRNLFMSTAHTQDEVDQFEIAVVDVTKKLIDVKVLPTTKSAGLARLDQHSSFGLTDHQMRFSDVNHQKSAIICVSAKVKGPLRVDYLQTAIEFIVNHYDLFRCRVSLAEKSQTFIKHPGKLDFQFASLRERSRPWKDLDNELKNLASSEIPIDQTNSLRIRLYDVADETHVMAVNSHHILFDGWTMTLFFEDLAKVYNQLLTGETPHLLPRLAFEKYLSERSDISSPVYQKANAKSKEAEKYWLKEFPQAPGKIFKSSSDEGMRIVFDLELQLYNGLKKWVQGEKMTPFMFLFSVYAWTVMQKKNLKEIVIGIPAAQREISGSDKMYGNCSNLLPIRLEATANVNGFIQNAKAKIVQAYAHMNYPYQDLKSHFGDILEIYFNLEPTSDLPELNDASLIIYPYPITHTEMPLMLNLTDFEHYYHCEFDFQTQAISDDEVLEIIDDLKKVIKNILRSKQLI